MTEFSIGDVVRVAYPKDRGDRPWVVTMLNPLNVTLVHDPGTEKEVLFSSGTVLESDLIRTGEEKWDIDRIVSGMARFFETRGKKVPEGFVEESREHLLAELESETPQK